MIEQAILRELAAHDGGPGLTANELATRLGREQASVRNGLAILVFHRQEITCERPTGAKASDARYRIGDPAALLGAPT